MNGRGLSLLLTVLVLYIGARVSISAQEESPSVVLLSENQSITGVISLEKDDQHYKTYLIQVPDEAFGVRVSLSRANADLDLAANYEVEAESFKAAEYVSDLPDYNEVLEFYRTSSPPLKTGVYYVDVGYLIKKPPRSGGQRFFEVPFALRYEVLPMPTTSKLSIGDTARGALSPGNGRVALFLFSVSRGVEALRLDLRTANEDLALLVNRGTPAFLEEEAELARDTPLPGEVLIWRNPSGLSLEPGDYYISVLPGKDNTIGSTANFSLSLVLSGDISGPSYRVSTTPNTLDPLEHVVYSTIEIFTEYARGSGSIVSSSGMIITSCHVVEDPDGKVSEEIYGGITTAIDLSPSEIFQLRVVEYVESLDLALLEVAGDYYGKPLPSGYRFSHLPIGNSDRLSLGQPIILVGYPGIGGLVGRPSVTITRGVVSGFQRTQNGRIVKTDAVMASGLSGGVVVDVFHQLVGIPTKTVTTDSGMLGYFIPISMIPDGWLRKIR